jgi:sporulation protein YlmC with PRC-barrel domain
MKALKFALVAVIATTVAHAQQGQQGQQAPPAQTQQQNDEASGQQPQKPPPVAGGAVLGVEVRELALIATGHRVSKLLGDTVYNDKNERIGRIDDFIVSPDGKITYAILEVGGFLQLGTHRVAIPVSQFSEVSPRLTLPGATKDALKQMPEFKYAKGQ